MAELRKFNRASDDEAKAGWTLEYGALQEIQDAARESSSVSQEDVEAVVLALAKCGYVSIAIDSPNDRAEGGAQR